MKHKDILYLQNPRFGVMTGHVYKRRRRWWFKCDALHSKPERLAVLLKEGWKPLYP